MEYVYATKLVEIKVILRYVPSSVFVLLYYTYFRIIKLTHLFWQKSLQKEQTKWTNSILQNSLPNEKQKRLSLGE
jgi:hypothetical protein